jgi:hypothetical protein
MTTIRKSSELVRTRISIRPRLRYEFCQDLAYGTCGIPEETVRLRENMVNNFTVCRRGF